MVHRKVRDRQEWMYTQWHQDKVKDTETGGSVTYFDEPVMLEFTSRDGRFDFLDSNGNSPLRRFRSEFFEADRILQV